MNEKPVEAGVETGAMSSSSRPRAVSAILAVVFGALAIATAFAGPLVYLGAAAGVVGTVAGIVSMARRRTALGTAGLILAICGLAMAGTLLWLVWSMPPTD